MRSKSSHTSLIGNGGKDLGGLKLEIKLRRSMVFGLTQSMEALSLLMTAVGLADHIHVSLSSNNLVERVEMKRRKRYLAMFTHLLDRGLDSHPFCEFYMSMDSKTVWIEIEDMNTSEWNKRNERK